MLTKPPKTLTNRAVQALLDQQATNEAVYVQLLKLQKQSRKITALISDGSYSTNAIFSANEELDPLKQQNSIIKITEHSITSKGVMVINFQKIARYQQPIGHPIDFKLAKQNREENVGENMIDPEFIINKEAQKKLPQTARKQPKDITQNQQSAKHTQPRQILQSSSKQDANQTIRGLYVGVSKWKIQCRVTKADYRQFQNKKGGLTKMLKVELIDRSKMKITGTFFGESAQKNKEFIQENHVYQIYNGQIKEDNYNSSKTSMHSPFTLIFNDHTVFMQVSDVNLIISNDQLITPLGQVAEQRLFSRQLEIAAILLEIQEEKQINNKANTKVLRKRQILLCDPQKEITMKATLWNMDAPDPSLLNKTVLLSRFKLHQYLESLSLQSNFTSTIKLLPDYQKMNKYEGSFDARHFRLVSEVQTTNNTDRIVYKNILQLKQALYLLNEQNQNSLVSEVDVWVSKFATGRKWHYYGCKKCMKALQSGMRCDKCQIFVQEAIPHYSIGVLVSDPYGSFWVTAMDELARRIFKQTRIEDLQKLNEEELQQQTKRYLFKEFKLKVVTKKDTAGRTKHNVVKIYEPNEQKLTKNNLQLIHKLLAQRN